MKRISYFLLAIAISLSACKSKKTSVTSEDGKDTVTVEPNQMENSASDMQKQMEELQKLPALTLEQLKALLPAELMGAKQSNYSATSMSGASYAHADYKLNDTVKVSLGVYDCAGSAGAGIFSAQYLTMMNIQQEDDNSYTKTVDFMNQKALEHCEKNRMRCTLTYLAAGRYLVTMEGDHVGADELKQTAQSLNMK